MIEATSGYEQYARSKSKKTMRTNENQPPEGGVVPRPKSRAGRLQGDGWDPGPRTSQDPHTTTERPKTGKGRRPQLDLSSYPSNMQQSKQENMDLYVGKPPQERPERPRTRGGRREPTSDPMDVTPTHDVTKPLYVGNPPLDQFTMPERPRTRHARRTDPMGEGSDYTPSHGQKSRRNQHSQGPQEDALSGPLVSQSQLYERPKTSHGRRQREAQSGDGFEPYERPMTSRGRRYEGQPDEEPIPVTPPPVQTDRPKSGKGKRGSSVSVDQHREQENSASDEVNILSLHAESPRPASRPVPSQRARPKSAKGRCRPQSRGVPTEYMESPRDGPPQTPVSSPVHVKQATHTVPLATPRDPPTYDVTENVMTPRSESSLERPTSAASLSKYRPLPAIGVGGSETGDTPRTPLPTPRKKSFESSRSNGPATPTVIPDEPPGVSSVQHVPQVLGDDTPIPAPRSSTQAPREGAVIDLSQLSESAQPLTRTITLPPEPSSEEPRLNLALKVPDGRRFSRFFRSTETLQVVREFAEVSAGLDFSNYHLVMTTPPQKVYSDVTLELGNSGILDKSILHVQLPDQ